MKSRRKEILKVALAQIDAEPGKLKANVDHIRDIILKYRDVVDLIIFPEYSVTGYIKGSANYDYAIRTEDEIFRDLVNTTGDVAVILGFIEETSSFNFFNSLAFINHRELIKVHRKIYLVNYGVFEERKHFSVGRKHKNWQLNRFVLSPFVCADAWNPALVHLAAADNSHALLFPACSPEEGLGGRLSTKESWYRLTRFYSTIYGLYTVFVNRVGNDECLTFWGGSEIIDPFGNVLVQSQKKEEEILEAELDLSKVREARTILHTIRDEDLGFIRRQLDDVLTKLHNEHD